MQGAHHGFDAFASSAFSVVCVCRGVCRVSWERAGAGAGATAVAGASAAAWSVWVSVEGCGEGDAFLDGEEALAEERVGGGRVCGVSDFECVFELADALGHF